MMQLPFVPAMKKEPMIEEIREMFQNFIAPQLEGIRGDIRAVDVKVDSFRRELFSEIRRVEEVLSSDFVRLEQKVDLKLEHFDTKLQTLGDKLELQRRELSDKLELQRRELLAELRATR